MSFFSSTELLVLKASQNLALAGDPSVINTEDANARRAFWGDILEICASDAPLSSSLRAYTLSLLDPGTLESRARMIRLRLALELCETHLPIEARDADRLRISGYASLPASR